MFVYLFLSLGLYYVLIKIPRLFAVNLLDLKDVPIEIFNKWKYYAMLGIVFYLLASWGVFIISGLFVFMLGLVLPEFLGIYNDDGGWLAFVAIFLLFVVLSGIYESAALKLKKKYDIKFKKSGWFGF